MNSQLELFSTVPVEDPPVLGTYRDRIEAAKENIRKIVLESDAVCVGFSGGKDSTVLLHLTIEVLREIQTNIKIYVIYSDTRVENPVLNKHNKKVLTKIQEYFINEGINAEIKIVQPKQDETFWTYIIGKGYSTPHRCFRWCQRVLKIQPVQRFLKMISEDKGVSLLLGHRSDESTTRTKVLKNKGNRIYKHSNISTFVPIRHIKESDIWEFLMSEKPPWDESYDSVVKLYRDARGECPLVPEKKSSLSGCGSRFGCWVCTLVQEDRSLKNMAKIDETVKPYIEFRNWLIEYCNRAENRLSYTRTGKKLGKGKGVLNFQAREEIFKRVCELEKETGKKVLSDAERKVIAEIWEKDKKLFENFMKGGTGLWQRQT